jgi:hypothetical protein
VHIGHVHPGVYLAAGEGIGAVLREFVAVPRKLVLPHKAVAAEGFAQVGHHLIMGNLAATLVNVAEDAQAHREHRCGGHAEMSRSTRCTQQSPTMPSRSGKPEGVAMAMVSPTATSTSSGVVKVIFSCLRFHA